MDNTKCKILLVEDDETLQFIVKDNLIEEGYRVDTAADGQQALQQFKENHYDLVLLDVMLPKVDGFKVAETIRKDDTKTPIIFLTARSMTEDKIKGLTIGGDDYISKPFSMEELLLKIKIFLRRSYQQPLTDDESKVHKIGKYIFNPDELQLTFDKKTKTLTLREAELILYFVKNKNKVLSRSEILKTVWGSDDYYLNRSLDVFLSRLRKYFSDDNNIKITTLHGIGYRFAVKK